ncbi:MAG: hypothetical protein QJR06_07495 [Alicyclobacillaceae bacterium]|nr:hypothetical protein [Alicyclobacillaceae bacterium]
MKKQIIAGALIASISFTAVSPAFAADTRPAKSVQAQPVTATQAQIATYDVKPESWKTKLAAAALRYATWFVSKVEPYIGKASAAWLKKNLGRLANFIETLDRLQELPIAMFLVNNGIPPADAQMIAHYIVLFFSPF